MSKDIEHKQEKIREKNEKLEEYELALECQKDKCQEAANQIASLEDRIVYLEQENQRLAALQATSATTITDLKEKNERAQQTIKVQSEQIKHPKDGRTYGQTGGNFHRPAALICYRGEDQSPQPSTEMVPYKNRGRGAPRTPTFRRFPPGRGTGYRQRGGFGEDSFSDRQSFHQQNVRSDGPQTRSFEAVIHQSNPRALKPPVSIGPILARLFGHTMSWCKEFCSDPSVGQDLSLSKDIWNELGQDINDPFLAGLLNDAKTRHLAVTKLVLGRLVNFSLFPKLIRNFKREYDDRSNAEKAKLGVGVPHHIRQESVIGINALARDIVKDREWEEFIGRKTASQVTELWKITEPLLDRTKSPEEAWTGLHHIFDEGVSAGLEMLQTLSMFSIDYPPVGNSSLFLKETMTNVDPYFKQDPTTLSRMNLKVRLAITPVINETSLVDLSRMQPHVLLFSKVLLKH